METPATFPFDVQNFLVADCPAEGMLVILGARNFILFVIEKFDVQMFAKAICVYMEFFVAFVDFATEYAVGKRKIGPV